ncbi:MAG: hypothetical protein RL329_2576 [Bacteroidota bacterium]|jgi:hypothetical protein
MQTMKKKWAIIVSLFLIKTHAFATIQQKSMAGAIVVKANDSFGTKTMPLRKRAVFQKQVPTLQKDTTDCVKISLKNGKTFYGVVKTMSPYRLTYLPCSEAKSSMDPLNIYTENIATLTSADGKIFYQYRAETEQLNARKKSRISLLSGLVAVLCVYQLLYHIEVSALFYLGATFLPLIALFVGLNCLTYLVRKKYFDTMTFIRAGIGITLGIITGLLGPFVWGIWGVLLVYALYLLLRSKKQ